MYQIECYINEPYDIINAYHYHQYIWNLFSPSNVYSSASRGWLFCILPDSKRHVLVQSDTPPIYEPPSITVRRVQKYPNDLIQKGETYKFEVRAYPIVSKNRGGRGTRGSKMRIMTEDGQKEWLKRKLANTSLNDPAVEFLSLECSPGPLIRYVSNRDTIRAAYPKTLLPVDFTGTIKCLNAAALNMLLRCGIGREKFLGCGLLRLEQLIAL